VDDERVNAAYGRQLLDAAHDGDSATVRRLLSAPQAYSFINYQDEDGITPLHFAVQQEHAAVAKQLIAARCNVDLQVLTLLALPVQKYKY
jgi:ankyrin repeat protein